MQLIRGSNKLVFFIQYIRVNAEQSQESVELHAFFRTLSSTSLFFTESKLHYITVILRLFSNDLLGVGDNFKGWHNYLEAPLFYIGILPILLMPQIFTIVKRRTKIIYLIYILILIIPIIFPFFRYAIWGFTGDYYRGFSLFISFFLLLYSLIVLAKLDRDRKINTVILFSTLIILIILLYYPYQNHKIIVDTEIQRFIRNLLLFYFGLIILIKYTKYKTIVQILLALTVCFELCYSYNYSFKFRNIISKKEMKEKNGYNDYTVEALQYIKLRDNQFFRIEKDYTSDYSAYTSMNDAKVQGYYGTKCYESFNQRYYIEFLEEMGLIKRRGFHDKQKYYGFK